jgi:hypothetical protein
MNELAKKTVPMDDRSSEGFEPSMAGRPTLIRGNSQLFFGGMGRLSENSVVSIKNRSFSLTAEVDIPDGGANGVIIAQGGRFGGWAVYVKDGKAKFDPLGPARRWHRQPRPLHQRRGAPPRRHGPPIAPSGGAAHHRLHGAAPTAAPAAERPDPDRRVPH